MSRPLPPSKLYPGLHSSILDDFLLLNACSLAFAFDSLESAEEAIRRPQAPLDSMAAFKEGNQQKHEILYTLGEADDRFLFASIHCPIGVSDVFVTFRPLNLVALETPGLWESAKFLKEIRKSGKPKHQTENTGDERENPLSCPELSGFSAILQIRRAIEDFQQGKFGAHRGLLELVKNKQYPINIRQGKNRKKSGNEDSSCLAWQPEHGDFGRSLVGALLHVFTKLSHYSNYRRIIFSGFSLGAALAVLSAVVLHDFLLENSDENSPPLPEFLVYQIAPMRVAYPTFQHAIEKHLSVCCAMLLTDDPVSRLPDNENIELRHAFRPNEGFLIDISRFTLEPLADSFPVDASPRPAYFSFPRLFPLQSLVNVLMDFYPEDFDYLHSHKGARFEANIKEHSQNGEQNTEELDDGAPTGIFHVFSGFSCLSFSSRVRLFVFRLFNEIFYSRDFFLCCHLRAEGALLFALLTMAIREKTEEKKKKNSRLKKNQKSSDSSQKDFPLSFSFYWPAVDEEIQEELMLCYKAMQTE